MRGSGDRRDESQREHSAGADRSAREVVPGCGAEEAGPPMIIGVLFAVLICILLAIHLLLKSVR